MANLSITSTTLQDAKALALVSSDQKTVFAERLGLILNKVQLALLAVAPTEPRQLPRDQTFHFRACLLPARFGGLLSPKQLSRLVSPFGSQLLRTLGLDRAMVALINQFPVVAVSSAQMGTELGLVGAAI